MIYKDVVYHQIIKDGEVICRIRKANVKNINDNISTKKKIKIPKALQPKMTPLPEWK